MFQEQKFDIPELIGISTKTIEEHLKLYAGYVKQTNMVLDKIAELGIDAENNMGLLSGLHRRLAFEFNGIRNHEVYFKQLEGGQKNLPENSELKKVIEAEGGSFEGWLSYFKSVATTRGIGWAMLYYDPVSGRLITSWVDEQHLGQLQNCAVILALDMWEHSFVADYMPSGKKQYVEDFFKNLNWGVIEKNYLGIIK